MTMKTELRQAIALDREDQPVEGGLCLSEYQNSRKVPKSAPDAAELPLGSEAYPQATGFELTSFSTPWDWRVSGRAEDQESNQRWIASITNEALLPMAELLPMGSSFGVEYDLAPKNNGALSLSCRLNIHAPAELSSKLTHDLEMCLATLSNHFGFRATSEPQKIFCGPVETWVLRPQGTSCANSSGDFGFARLEEKSCAVRLPLPNSSSRSVADREDPTCARDLSNFLRAARTLRHALRLRISLVRERLPESTGKALEDLLECDPVNVIKDATSLLDRKARRQVVQGFTGNSRDILRLKVEVDLASNTAPCCSLLGTLAAALFPGLRVEIVPKDSASVRTAEVIDLADVVALSGPLPPLLPSLPMLETLGFPRHFLNPGVRLAEAGVFLGHALVGGVEQRVHIPQSDRSRHVYLLGATGTGKSTLLQNMLRQDMDAGRGIGLIDPHGDLFTQIKASIPEHRQSNVIIIDPSDEKQTVGLNPLDFFGPPTLDRVNRVINDLLDIFGEFWDMNLVAGPMFELYFRNSFLLACTTPFDSPPEGLPQGPATFLTAIEVMRNKEFRETLLNRCSDSYLGADVGGEVVRFFRSAEAVSGEHSFANWVPYITSKLARFTNNPQLRRLLCTPKRTVDFRKAIDQGSIVLVKLSKGFLGDLDTRMIGMLITKYLFHAALSREDVACDERRPFYLYLDEFQNFVSKDMSDVLSEARKYGLYLTLAHQTLGQFKTKHQSSILEALLGNVATKLIFRIGLQEGQLLEGNFLPHFDASALASLPDHHVLARVLVHNEPSLPFLFKTTPAG